MKIRLPMVILALGLVSVACGIAFFRAEGPPPDPVALEVVRRPAATADHDRVIVSPAEPAPEPSRAPEASRAPARPQDWTRKYHESNDDFALARELVAAAVDGDAHA